MTTKLLGKATGLGLAISSEIIAEKHRGKLWCESKLGVGRKFGIEVPARLASIPIEESDRFLLAKLFPKTQNLQQPISQLNPI